MSNDDPSQHTTSTTTKKVREQEYMVECWQIFEQIKEGKKVIADKCLIYGTEYKYNSAHGTGVFKRHKEKHDKKMTKFLQNKELVWSKHNSAQGGYFKYDPTRVRNFFIKYIARGEKPMSMIYDLFFEKFIREYFHPQYKRSYWLQMNNELFSIF